MTHVIVTELLKTLEFAKAYEYTDIDRSVTIQDGKLRVFATDAFFQLQNSVTRALPNFTLSREALEVAVNWLDGVDNVGNLVVRDNSLLFDFDSSTLEVPRTLDSDEFANVDELVKEPLIDNNFSGFIELNGFARTVNSLSAIPEFNKTSVAITIEGTEDEKGVISFVVEKGPYITTIKKALNGTLPNRWSNNYHLASLARFLRWLKAHNYDKIELSFTTDEDGSSSLILLCDNGVTVVLLPVKTPK